MFYKNFNRFSMRRWYNHYPINFFCSIRKKDKKLRKDFMSKYSILTVTIFNERVFNDTSALVCCLQFEKSNNPLTNIKFIFRPSQTTNYFIFSEENDYSISILNNLEISNSFSVSRTTNNIFSTNILVKCVDNNSTNKIKMELILPEDLYKYSKQSSRSYLVLDIKPDISSNTQALLVEKFNKFLNEKRDLFNSLFLTNFRESTNNNFARKRISFDQIYKIVKHLL